MLKKIKNHILKKRNKLLYVTDLHSHLLPEIDDGCNDIDETLLLVKKMRNLGYKKLILTPHVMLKKYPNTSKIITSRLFELRAMLKVKNISMEVEASAEYYCDNHFIKLIVSNDLLTFGERYVLFELPYKTLPETLEKVLKLLFQKAYIPVLAHPERYSFLKTVVDFRKMKSRGVLFQVNINSIGGYYGKEVQKKALMLSQKSMIDFVGSDLHNQKQMNKYEETIFSNQIETLFSNNTILNDLI